MASASSEPVSLNTGRLAERAIEVERNPQIFALPTPRLARKWSTWNPPSHAEGVYPQNCMVELPRDQVPEMHFDKFPDPYTFQCWKTSFETEVCSCSSFLCGYCVVDQRSRGGQVSGRSHDVAINKRTYIPVL